MISKNLVKIIKRKIAIAHKTYKLLENLLRPKSLFIVSLSRFYCNTIILGNKHLNRLENFVKHIVIAFINIFTFIKVMVVNPRETGAIIPSSKNLAAVMVAQVIKNKGIVLELGAGTGVVTKELLRSGILPENIIVIEYSHDFVKNLKHQFPELRIIEGNAANLMTLLGNDAHKVNTIISSIPLRSLPRSLAESIIQQIKTILPKSGRYIQFTYSLKRDIAFSLDNCNLIFSKRIWLNVPPARVDVWEPKK